LGIGWWIPSDTQHPDFVAQPEPSSQSAPAQPESIQASGTQTTAYEEFLSTATHLVTQISRTLPLTPETQEAPITSQILDVAVAGYSFTLDTEAERLSAAVPESEHLSMADLQISTTLIPQTQNPAPTNGSSLFGALLEVFDKNRGKAKEYMHSLKHWWALNKEKTVFDIPYKWVTLCLSYMKGPKIEDWVKAQQEFINDQKSTGRLANFESH